MKLIIIDNFDSFTYNLFHYLEPMVDHLEVERSDKVNVESLKNFDKIVYSPGPGIPSEYKIMFDVLERYDKQKAILGICLGHQAIIEYYGGKLTNLKNPLHGLTIPVNKTANKDPMFDGISNVFDTGRYHSWAGQLKNLPKTLIPTVIDENQMVMALKHKNYNIRGMQFHPESVMTPKGKKMLSNWIIHC